MALIDQNLGCMLVGVLMATFLQGVLSLQLYYYYTNYKKDSLWLKTLVFAAWASDVIHLVLICHGLYHYSVTVWGNEDALLHSTWQLDSHVAVTGVSCFLCQAYFLRRLYILSGHNWKLVPLPLAMALGSFVLDAVITSEIIRIPLFSEFAKTTAEAIGTFSLAAATDTFIALLLCLFLHRQKTEFRRTQRLVNKVIQYTVSTGLLTSIGAIVSLALFVISPNSLVFFTIYLSLGSLYTNSLLASLNTRQALCKLNDEEEALPSLSVHDGSVPLGHSLRTQTIQIVVSRMTTEVTDVDKSIPHDTSS